MSGKFYRKAKENIKKQQHSLEEAINIIKNVSYVKFNESCDLSIRLGVDPKKSGQAIRGMVALPHGRGKEVRVAVISNPENAKLAKAAGASIAGDMDVIEDIKSGKIEFDICIATPDMMGKIGQVSRILGPKGLMPNPKLGTVTTNVVTAVEAAQKGQIEFRVDKTGIIHAPIGKISFEVTKLLQNAETVIKAIIKAKPTEVKGTYLKKIYLSGSMTPSVAVDLGKL